MILSSTLVKSFLHKGNLRNYCPRYIKEVIIERNYDITSDAILRGNVFETLCIGRGRDDKITPNLPLTTRNTKRIDQVRLEHQAEEFKRLCKVYGIILTPENTQLKLRKKLSDGIFLEGHPDILPVSVNDPRRGQVLATIDLKLAKFLENTFGEYCWGDYFNYDDIQMQIYPYLAEDLDLSINDVNKEIFEVVQRNELYAYYWTFSYAEGKYKGKHVSLQNKIFPVEKSSLKKKEMLESLRKTYKLYLKHESEGWKPIPGDPCDKCPVECPEKIDSGILKQNRLARREKLRNEIGEF